MRITMQIADGGYGKAAMEATYPGQPQAQTVLKPAHHELTANFVCRLSIARCCTLPETLTAAGK